jgi:hypothetical protein
METKHTVKLRMFQFNTDTIRKGVKAMEKGKWIGPWKYLFLLSAVLVIAAVSPVAPANGVVTCPTTSQVDSDGDGFTDQQECDGISFAGSPNNFIYGRLNAPANLPRAERLDPDTEDVFVILASAVTGSKIPANPLVFVSNTVASGGLGIFVHLIPVSYVSDEINRFVSPTSGQRAVHIAESLDPGLTTEQKNTMGVCDQGMVLDGCIVYTQRIENKIATICCGTPTCTSWRNDPNCKDKVPLIVSGEALLYKYIKHTIAHEFAHAINLKVDPPHHSNPSTSNPKEMDSAVAVKGKVFSIGVVFTSADQAGLLLE